MSVVEEIKIKYLTFVSYKWLGLTVWWPFLPNNGAVAASHFLFIFIFNPLHQDQTALNVTFNAKHTFSNVF